MCFCLLPVTGFRFEFCFSWRGCGLRILDIFMIFVTLSRIYLCAKDWESASGFIQQIWTIIKNCH